MNAASFRRDVIAPDVVENAFIAARLSRRKNMTGDREMSRDTFRSDASRAGRTKSNCFVNGSVGGVLPAKAAECQCVFRMFCRSTVFSGKIRFGMHSALVDQQSVISQNGCLSR